MLLLTFCKVSPHDLKPKPLHAWLLLIQIAGALAAYLLLYRFNKIVAERGHGLHYLPYGYCCGSDYFQIGRECGESDYLHIAGEYWSSYCRPYFFFPLVEVHPDVSFWGAFFVILSKVFPLLICPFLAAWLLGKCLPKVHQKLLGYHELAFYLWAVSLAIVTAQTLYSLLNDPADGFTEIMIAVGALVACCLQFFLGKTIGSVYNDRISGGQALGAEEYDSGYLDGTYLSQSVIFRCSGIVCAVAEYYQ